MASSRYGSVISRATWCAHSTRYTTTTTFRIPFVPSGRKYPCHVLFFCKFMSMGVSNQVITFYVMEVHMLAHKNICCSRTNVHAKFDNLFPFGDGADCNFVTESQRMCKRHRMPVNHDYVQLFDGFTNNCYRIQRM